MVELYCYGETSNKRKIASIYYGIVAWETFGGLRLGSNPRVSEELIVKPFKYNLKRKLARCADLDFLLEKAARKTPRWKRKFLWFFEVNDQPGGALEYHVSRSKDGLVRKLRNTFLPRYQEKYPGLPKPEELIFSKGKKVYQHPVRVKTNLQALKLVYFGLRPDIVQ